MGRGWVDEALVGFLDLGLELGEVAVDLGLGGGGDRGQLTGHVRAADRADSGVPRVARGVTGLLARTGLCPGTCFLAGAGAGTCLLTRAGLLARPGARFLTGTGTSARTGPGPGLLTRATLGVE
ncbi:hypothetical protein ADK35_28120 [Streptomyces viridochromogenes]|nr:hypothetical protein ADK35_28120 [Streptomyces viridochromogenes]